MAADTGLHHLSGQLVVQQLLKHLRTTDECLKVYASSYSHLVEHMDEVLRRYISRGSRCVRVTPETADAGVKTVHPDLEGGQDVGQAHPAGIVQVQAQGGVPGCRCLYAAESSRTWVG